ncbi:MAG: YtxH domain-containing protein [Oscillospiraceae bacterium]
MKGLGILMVGLLAVAGGVAAATYITKKKLEKENEENYYDDWDDDFDDDDLDFDFDEDIDISAPETTEAAEAVPASTLNDDLAEDEKPADEGDL